MQLDCEVDGIQKLMDELYTTLLTLQDSNKEVLDARLTLFSEKAKELESLFTQIDIIHQAVSNISSNVTQLEVAATAIDKQVDSNPLKKMFGFFKGSSERESDEVTIPQIFNTQTLLSRDVTPREVR
ncbi:uncharacterized protein LOC134825646 isoform X2 [Bolinopsis microptera]|uniref:uncharacterized protein LOC134825646 isoform X2 n=1 Tax=Bolinopsis microptera TaxID=2820187 RepID=UPI003079BDD4